MMIMRWCNVQINEYIVNCLRGLFQIYTDTYRGARVVVNRYGADELLVEYDNKKNLSPRT